MKLLITTDNFLPQWDGIARFLNEMLPRLKGHEITVIAPDYGTIHVKGFELIQIDLAKKDYGGYIPAKTDYKTIKKHVKQADVVFNQTLGPIGARAILAARKYNKPVVSFTHSIEWELVPKAIKSTLLLRIIRPILTRIIVWLYNRCTLIIVPSKDTAEKLSWRGVRTAKRVVHLGVDVEKFTTKNIAIAKKNLGFEKDTFIVGYHGRISREKSLITLLRAFLRLPIKNKKLLIVGDGLEEIKHKLKRKDVIITGMQSDVIQYLQAMDVYVLPSLTETTSLSVLEAMACGKIVVSTPVGFINDYIKDTKNGFFFKQRDPFMLAKKIEHIKRLSADERSQLQAAARATVVEHFRWEKTAKEITKILKIFEKE